MKRALLVTAFVVISIVLVAWPSREKEVEHPKPSYVGADKCKVCHLDTYNSWKTTAHARAFSTLKAAAAQDSTCLRCHTTGFGDGGFGAEGNIIDLAGVQCEACHGAGSLYWRSSAMRQPGLSHELGLVDVDSTTCIMCHNEKSPTFKGFAYKAGLLSATHTLKSGKRATAH